MKKMFLPLAIVICMQLQAQKISTDSDMWNTYSAKNWTVEDASGKAEVKFGADFIEIIAPDGLTLWYNTKLEGCYTVSYKAKFITEGGKYERLSDLNCFWAAGDPEHPDDIFARSKWRNGIFQRYRSLDLFYVGYGGNSNTTTRFRRYYGELYGQEDDTVRPLIKEYTDEAYLLKKDHWHNVMIEVKDSLTTYHLNGELLFSLPLVKGEGNGYFGIRLVENHIIVSEMEITEKPAD